MDSPWAYIRESLLLEGYLGLRFGVLIFRWAFFGGEEGRGGAAGLIIGILRYSPKCFHRDNSRFVTFIYEIFETL